MFLRAMYARLYIMVNLTGRIYSSLKVEQYEVFKANLPRTMQYIPLTQLRNDESACKAIFELVTAGCGPTEFGYVEDSELGYITLWEKYGSGSTRHIHISNDGSIEHYFGDELEPVGNVFKLVDQIRMLGYSA
ncbi:MULTISPECIES: hypothetical protein [Dyadobacter]|uniref:Uncharacterized protein n=1 Tax=Dyadobacter chenhuakuii TaxID=2909339 RepID=A0ABY5EA67_9BACT|nr:MULTISPECIES: hypothetical protein [Dyadobacter]UTM21810.1 hypothetical protein NFI80_25390 [Dyadobacter chenhuakuii]